MVRNIFYIHAFKKSFKRKLLTEIAIINTLTRKIQGIMHGYMNTLFVPLVLMKRKNTITLMDNAYIPKF